MPSRTMQWLIVLCWLATAGWYVRREVMPYWTADTMPAYAVDLADEAARTALQVQWTLTRKGHKPCPLRTTVDYHDADDEFSLNCTLFNLDLIHEIKVEKYRSSYRVNRWGRLIANSTSITIGKDGLSLTLNSTARVENGTAIVTWQMRSPWMDLDPPAASVKMADAGALNPLHPVHRLRNVRPGQRWVQPLTDPLADAQRIALAAIAKQYTGVNFKQFAGPGKAKDLFAEVTGQTPLEWHDQFHDCFVITYRSDNYAASTWVRVADGLVLRQEASSSGDEWTLQRD